MSQYHSCAAAQHFPDFAQNLKISMHNNISTTSTVLCLHVLKKCDFCVIFIHFFAQNFQIKVLTVQETRHLECLAETRTVLKQQKEGHWVTLIDCQEVMTAR